MPTRFNSEFYNIRNEIWNVSIDDKDYVGDAITIDTMEDGFTLSYADEEYIIGSKVNINIFVDQTTTAAIDTFLADLLISEEGRFTVKITWKATPASGAQQYWVGFVLPDLSGYDDQLKYIFTVTATDGLGRLKGVDYLDDSGLTDVPYGFITIHSHILNCLNELATAALYYSASSGVFLRTVVNWVDGTIGAPATAVCPTTRMQVSGYVVAKRDDSDDGDGWEFMSCYDVLLQMCKHLHARLLFSQGAFRFEQFNERDQDTFFERTYARDGTLIGSSATAGYDKTIDQGAGGFKIATALFNFRPALKKAVIDYDHQTYKNYLEGLQHKWYYGSTNLTDHEIENISVDADTVLKVSGRLFINAEADLLTAPFAFPWRYVFQMLITGSGGHRLRKGTTSVVDSQGNGTNQVIDVPGESGEWVIGTSPYEISTDFVWTDAMNVVVSFSFTTPVVPAGTTSLTVGFIDAWAEDNANNQQIAILNNWQITDLVLIIQGSDTAANYEAKRTYEVANPVAGNSEVFELETLFGHAVKPWTERKILTSADGVTWVNTAATWTQGTSGTAFEFGELLAAEVMSTRRTPTKLLNGSVSGLAIHAHSRLVTIDTLGWIMKQATMVARVGVWTGEWINAGVDRITSGPIIKKKPYSSNVAVGLPPPPPNNAFVEGVSSPMIGKGSVAFSALTVNFLGTSLPSRNVTSIDLQYPVAANTYLAGDNIIMVDPQSGHTEYLEVAADAAEGDTSLSIVFQTVTHDYVLGSHILYGPLNKMTNQGGGGSAGGVRKVDYKEFAAIGGTKTINGKIMSAYFAADSAGLARTISIGTTSGGYEICENEPINNGSRWTLAYTDFFDSPTFYVTCSSGTSMYFGYDTL
jgi:hypothetical protein